MTSLLISLLALEIKEKLFKQDFNSKEIFYLKYFSFISKVKRNIKKWRHDDINNIYSSLSVNKIQDLGFKYNLYIKTV